MSDSNPANTKTHFIRLLERYGRHPEMTEYAALIENDESPFLKFARILRQDKGEYLFAYDVVQHGLTSIVLSHDNLPDKTGLTEVLQHLKPAYKTHFLNLKQEEGILLNNLDLHQQSIEIFEGLRQAGKADEETLGNLASAYKRRGIKRHTHNTTDDAVKNDFKADFQQALYFYQTHFEQHPESYWTGINAVVLGLTLGDRAQAIDVLARLFSVLDALKSAQNSDIWLVATHAEALLLSYVLHGDKTPLESVVHAYETLGKLARNTPTAHHKGLNVSVLKSARVNLPIILKWPLSPDMTPLCDAQRDTLNGQIDACIQMPAVILFSGHMTDEPDRTTPRFPEAQSPAVKTSIRQFIRQHDANWGYSSGARGADLLFLEEMLEHNAEIEVVLPYDQQNFLNESVRSHRSDGVAIDNDWVPRFHDVMEQAYHHHYVWQASPIYTKGVDKLYEYANDVIHGLALQHAEQLGSKLYCLAVWDGKPTTFTGGTAETVRRWVDHGHAVHVIDPLAPEQWRKLEPEVCQLRWPSKNQQTLNTLPIGEVAIRTLVFTDVAGYSKFDDHQIRTFFLDVLGAAAAQLASYEGDPEERNTWGDALALVFRNLRNALDFSVSLAQIIKDGNTQETWRNKGLPHPLKVRIAVHTGPVTCWHDPVQGTKTFVGTHLSNAARIEPVTPPGEIFGSMAVAAYMKLERIVEFECRFVGRVPLPKNYGVFPLFHITRSRDKM